MADEYTCPNCTAVGVIEGIAHEVVPDLITCGHCRTLFTYRQNAWDRIRKDYFGPLTPFFLKVTQKPTDYGKGMVERVLPALERMAAIKKVPNRVLLNAYRAARRGDSVDPKTSIWLYQARGAYTGAEVKAELDTRPHVPNKKEAKELRRRAAQGKVR